MSAPKSKTVKSALAIGMYVQLEAWIVKKKKKIFFYFSFVKGKAQAVNHPHLLSLTYMPCLCWWSMPRDKDGSRPAYITYPINQCLNDHFQ